MQFLIAGFGRAVVFLLRLLTCSTRYFSPPLSDCGDEILCFLMASSLTVAIFLQIGLGYQCLLLQPKVLRAEDCRGCLLHGILHLRSLD